MKKLFISLICGMAVLSVAGVCSDPVMALTLAPCEDNAEKAACIERQNEIIRRWDNGEPLETILADLDKQDQDAKTEIPPTFSTELSENDRSVKFKLGHSLILTGNNLTTDVANKSGFMLAAGNNLSLRTAAEYSFLVGNTISFAGETTRDLYIAGNSITLTHDAKIGRDVFAAANTLAINADIAGDLAVTADTLVLKDIKISGNLNLDVAHVEFIGQVEVAGAMVYNDNAEVTGLDRVKSGSTEVYHIEQVDPATLVVARVYGKVLSMAALFLVMAIICACYPHLHDKLDQEATVGRFGNNLALGLGVLIAVPIVALFAFFTLVAAPLGVIALAIYLIAIYLAQGFAGAWFGHVLIEKLFKMKGNIFVEALVGIVLLGLFSVIPYLGVATGFLGLLLGLGIILNCVKPAKFDKAQKPAAKAAKA